jgi:hypothetical protein
MISRAAAAFSSRTVTVRASRVCTMRLPGDVVDVEQERGPVLLGEQRGVLGRQEWLGRLVVGAARSNGDQLALRPAQRREPTTEDAAGVDVDGVVQPLSLGNRGVPVDDRGLPAIVGRPLQANRESELVGLPCRPGPLGQFSASRTAALSSKTKMSVE